MSTEANTQEACIPIILEFLFFFLFFCLSGLYALLSRLSQVKSGMFYNANVKDKWLVHPEDNAIV